MQNVSHAVMAQRAEPGSSLDDFPTPPWATRAFIEHILLKEYDLSNDTCLEPACGRGYMSKVLSDYFGTVTSSDISDYGYAPVSDFLQKPCLVNEFDWVITNPPFKHAEQFAEKAASIASKGFALLTRTVFIESIGRYQRLFSLNRPTLVAQYAERVPMVKGRLDKRASTATGYCWLVWDMTKQTSNTTELLWIPPCRKYFERDEDYT